MKKLIAILAFLTTFSANATNWVYMGQSTSGDNASYYIDVDNMVWENTQYNQRSTWTQFSYPNGSYALHRFEIHCPSQMFRLKKIYEYNSYGTLFKTSGPTIWENIVPGSFAQDYANKLCINQRSPAR